LPGSKTVTSNPYPYNISSPTNTLLSGSRDNFNPDIIIQEGTRVAIVCGMDTTLPDSILDLGYTFYFSGGILFEQKIYVFCTVDNRFVF